MAKTEVSHSLHGAIITVPTEIAPRDRTPDATTVTESIILHEIAHSFWKAVHRIASKGETFVGQSVCDVPSARRYSQSVTPPSAHQERHSSVQSVCDASFCPSGETLVGTEPGFEPVTSGL
ncbi:hypothetical protein ACOMHN_053519 [Nucella lapillus]